MLKLLSVALALAAVASAAPAPEPEPQLGELLLAKAAFAKGAFLGAALSNNNR